MTNYNQAQTNFLKSVIDPANNYVDTSVNIAKGMLDNKSDEAVRQTAMNSSIHEVLTTTTNFETIIEALA